MLSNGQALQTYPHDPDAFTQGLEYQRACNRTGCQDIFWESTGAAAHEKLYGGVAHGTFKPLFPLVVTLVTRPMHVQVSTADPPSERLMC